MAVLNYAQQYSKELAQAYPYVLYSGALWNTENSTKYKVVDAKTIQIPSISVGGRTNGDRDNIGSFTRNFDNAWETKTLSNHRDWQTLVHPKDVNETNMVASISNITKVMNEEENFPEMDAYIFSNIFKLRNEQKAITPLSTESNICFKKFRFRRFNSTSFSSIIFAAINSPICSKNDTILVKLPSSLFF